MSLEEHFVRREERGERDAKRFHNHDEAECMLCGAYGDDKRSLFLRCFYDVTEAVTEFIDLRKVKDFEDRGFYLRICKSCRARLLQHLRQWGDECRALQDKPKDHDGCLLDENTESDLVPVRTDGVIEYITVDEWHRRREKTA